MKEIADFIHESLVDHDWRRSIYIKIESGVNYAVLAPGITCTLTGYKYSHMTRVVTAGSLTASEQATKRLDDCALVNIFNVDSVAQRWLEYYSSQKVVTISNTWNGEQPADTIVFSDPYDDQAVGMIESQDVRLSAKIAADITVQAGKIPTSAGNTYNHVLVVTQSGQITIPAEAKGKAQLVLISGGPGGSSGYAGEVLEGKTTTDSQSGSKTKYFDVIGVAAGGQPGDPGGGPRILRVTMDVTAGQTLNVTIGAGGTGGLFSDGENAPGQPGGDTIVGTYTTANAPATETGYYEQLTGVLYGVPGSAGVPGGASAGWDTDTQVLVPAETVSAFGQIFTGGASEHINEYVEDHRTATAAYGYLEATAYGSYGGGAAYGNNGEDGTLTGAVASAGALSVTARGAPGGKGADALPPPVPTVRGSGGYGGNGGGGAGPSGSAKVYNYYAAGNEGQIPDVVFVAAAGVMTPGNGSDGGKGADGVLLIYY